MKCRKYRKTPVEVMDLLYYATDLTYLVLDSTNIDDSLMAFVYQSFGHSLTVVEFVVCNLSSEILNQFLKKCKQLTSPPL